MKLKIQKQLDAVDNQLQQLVQRLSKHSEEDLNRKPSETEWSIMQVMVHLQLAEFYTMESMKKKLSNGNVPKKNSLKGKLITGLYPVIFNMPVKITAPEAISGEALPIKSSFWDVTKQWKKQRADLRSFMTGLNEEQLKGEVFKHPIFGRSDAYGLLKFYLLHTKRHEKQINRLLSYYKC